MGQPARTVFFIDRLSRQCRHLSKLLPEPTEKFLFGDKNRSAIVYGLSAAKLLLPKEYGSWHTNVNCKFELLVQTTPGIGYTYRDMTPWIQLTVNSRPGFGMGYRFPLIESCTAMLPGVAYCE